MEIFENLQQIIITTNIDEPCKLEILLLNSWNRLEKIISKTSDSNLNQVLSTLCVKSKADHETVQLGLLYRLLTGPESSSTTYRDISTTCRDNFQTIFKVLCSLVSEYFFKISPISLQQLFWFTNESLRNSLSGIDGLVYNMLRSLTASEGSKLSFPIHLQITQTVIDLVNRNMKYLINHPHLIRDTVTILLTLIPHHSIQPNLFNQEVNICAFLLNERFDECALIGRDLIRLLINVANINGLHKVWQRIVSTCEPLSDKFPGPLSILIRPTSKHLVMTSLSHTLDQYLNFLLNFIAHSNPKTDDSIFKHYFKWISKRIFSHNGESSILKPNIVRYLILNHFSLENSNELNFDESNIFNAKSIVIEWLLNISQNNKLEHSNIKLALFYELIVFSYDGTKPHSTTEITCTWKIIEAIYKRKPALASQLAEFIPTLVSQFIPSLKDSFQTSIYLALDFCFAITPIKPFECYLQQKYPTESNLMNGNSHSSPNNLSNDGKNNNEIIDSNSDVATKTHDNTDSIANLKGPEPSVPNKSHSAKKPIVSQEINQINKNMLLTSNSPKKETVSKQKESNHLPNEPSTKTPSPKVTKLSSSPHTESNNQLKSINDIDKPLQKLILLAVKKMGDWTEFSNVLSMLLENLISITHSNVSTSDLVNIIVDKLSLSFEKCLRIFFKNYNKGSYNTFDGKMDYSLVFMCPIFVLIKQLKISGEKHNIIWSLIDKLRQNVPLVSFFILFFDLFESSAQRDFKTRKAKINTSKNDNIEIDECIYLKYILKWMNKTTEDALYEDLERCSILSHKLYSFSLLKIYKLFGSKMVEESRFIHLVVGSMDSNQIKSVISHIISGEISLIPNDDLVDIIDDSLEWESFEQIFFWQILLSHNKLPLNQVWQILPELDWNDHAEAINALVPLMRLTQPKVDIMKFLFARQNHGAEDEFIVLILTLWEDRFEASVLSTLQNYLNHLKQNSRVECRNITLTLEQLSVIFVNGHCNYIFKSPNILLSIEALRPHLPSMNKNLKNMYEYVIETNASMP